VSGETGEPVFELEKEDVRSIVRLLSDVMMTPGGLLAQKRRCAEGVADLVGADYWMWNVCSLKPDAIPLATAVMHNLSEKQVGALMEANYRGDLDAIDSKFLPLTREGAHFTCRGDQLLTAEEFEQNGSRRVYVEELDFSHSYMFSAYPIPGHDDLFHNLGLWRKPGRPMYTPRESRIAHIIASEVGWIHLGSVPGVSTEEFGTLSPRLQTVLSLLVEGLAAKRIAFHMKIAEHTARDYIKDLYRRLDCKDRADLMRRFMVGDGGDATV